MFIELGFFVFLPKFDFLFFLFVVALNIYISIYVTKERLLPLHHERKIATITIQKRDCYHHIAISKNRVPDPFVLDVATGDNT